MDVLIFNSGFGSRILELIKSSHKSLLNVNGESILARQLRILSEYDIEKVIITTGPNAECIHEEVKIKNYPFEIVFVHSSKYAETNYIYSMYLAHEYLNNDILILHGDLVFNQGVIDKLLNEEDDSVLIDSNFIEYEKDFKAVVDDGYVKYISTKIDTYRFGLQPIYKLSKGTLNKWKNRINQYIIENNTKVYAENALNELLSENEIKLRGVLIDNEFCKEIDDPIDYEKVKLEINEFDYRQEIIVDNFDIVLKERIEKTAKILVVTFDIIKPIVTDRLSDFNDVKFIIYNDANPEKNEIMNKINDIESFNPDYVVSIGGGSVIDFTKCLIDFSSNEPHHIAVPTTCGTGSESTKFAVYYIDGIKQSLNKNKVLPKTAILDQTLLERLPKNVLISSVLDAFAQAIESFWSKKSTGKSKELSIEAIKRIFPILDSGFSDDFVLSDLQVGANLAGQAINITTTTAPHALSYNLTKLFNVSHGVAVALTLPIIWELHLNRIPNFDLIMKPINDTLGVTPPSGTLQRIKKIFHNVGVELRTDTIESEIEFLVSNVNLERLSNNPLNLSKNDIKDIYMEVFKSNNDE